MAEKRREAHAFSESDDAVASRKSRTVRETYSKADKSSIKLLRSSDVSKMFWSTKTNWSSLAAGLLIAIVIQLVLVSISSFMGLGIVGAANVSDLQNTVTGFSLWVLLCSLIASFAGSYISSRISGNRFTVDGITTGIFVWALFLLAGIILNALGVNGLLSYGSNAISVLRGVEPSGGAISLDEINTAASIAVIQTRYFFIGALLSLVSAVFGGWLGSEKKGFAEATDFGQKRKRVATEKK
ncbi:MAG: hypothetical protein HY779_04585 [Rubrobacteridae bacterium]|nr:hypothetical protein [Rubrobacteridae bacterium]